MSLLTQRKKCKCLIASCFLFKRKEKCLFKLHKGILFTPDKKFEMLMLIYHWSQKWRLSKNKRGCKAVSIESIPKHNILKKKKELSFKFRKILFVLLFRIISIRQSKTDPSFLMTKKTKTKLMEISKTKQLAFVRRFYFIFPTTLRETIRK